jgi:hypothetical protein
MAIYITEYSTLARDFPGWHVAAGQEPAVAEQVRTISGTSAQSAPFSSATAFVMVHASAAAHLAFGSNPVATTGAHRIGAGETRFYGVRAGQRLAAIQGS